MKKVREKGLVSIIVTNYNNEKYIVQCLDSLVKQTYSNIEIIIIDDASTDNSVQVITNWINTDVPGFNKKEQVFFHCLKRNIGFSGAVTTGLYFSKGEFIAMHDGDDYSHPERIEKQVKFLKTYPHIQAVGTNYAVFSNEDPVPKLEPNFVKYNSITIKEEYALGHTAVSYGTLLFYGYIFDNIGGLTRKLDGAEDYEYITKMLHYGIANISEPLYLYRKHEKQRSREFYSHRSAKKKSYNKDDLKILLVLDRFNIGGTETHVLTLAKELIRKGFSITILGGDGPLGEEFKKLNCKIYNINFPLTVPTDTKTINIFVNEIRRVISAENINIIHAHQSPSGSLAIAAAKKFNIPCIFTIHGMYYDDIINNGLKSCDSVISVSYPVFDWLMNFEIQSTVIPNGIIFDEYNDVDPSILSALRREYNISDNSIIAMYCSRMAWGKIKTCENLIRVCRDLNLLDNIDIHALIVGNGPGYDSLVNVGKRVNESCKREIIHFTGSQVDVAKYYLVSDCIVGTGRVTIEGMASRKPIIATGNNGYCGIITENNFQKLWRMYFGDHDAITCNDGIYLYDDLKTLCRNIDNYKSSVNKLYELSKSMFDISVIADNIIEVYLSFLK